MFDLQPETKLIVDGMPDGKFTFRVLFRGETQPTSRPMASREDAELLGNLLIKQLERKALAERGATVLPLSAPIQLF